MAGALGDRALRPAQPKSMSFSDELDDLADTGVGAKILFQLLDARLECAGFRKQPVDSLLHGLDLRLREAAAFQTNKVETGKVGTITLYASKRDDITFDTRRAADHCEGADSDELMYRCQATDNYTIPHTHMPAKGCVIGHDHMISDQTVVCNVCADHEQAVIADDRPQATSRGSWIHGYIL